MSQQSNPATLRELVRRWNEVASKIANRPTSTPETRAQATGWAQCADELEAALAASGTEAAPDEIAKRFHEAYERLAPSFGYQTRKESAVPWEQVPENNRKLMTAVVAEVLGQPAQAAASPELAPKLVIERMPDWNFGAFLNETDASCIAIGATKEEARLNGMRELARRAAASPEGEGREAANFSKHVRETLEKFERGELSLYRATDEITSRQSAAPSGGAELRELSVNATQGGWVRSKHCFQIVTADGMNSVTELSCPRGLATYPSDDRVEQHRADVDFMVACVNYVRSLLAQESKTGAAPSRNRRKQNIPYLCGHDDCPCTGGRLHVENRELDQKLAGETGAVTETK